MTPRSHQIRALYLQHVEAQIDRQLREYLADQPAQNDNDEHARPTVRPGAYRVSEDLPAEVTR